MGGLKITMIRSPSTHNNAVLCDNDYWLIDWMISSRSLVYHNCKSKHNNFTTPVLMGSWILDHAKVRSLIRYDTVEIKIKLAWIVWAVWIKSIKTGVLLVEAHSHDNHRQLSYHDNGFAIQLSHYRYYCTSLRQCSDTLYHLYTIVVLRSVKQSALQDTYWTVEEAC